MADVNKLRSDVSELLALTEAVHKPNNGTIAELCRTWLAVHDAGGLPELLAIAEASESLRADAMRWRALRDATPNALHLSRNGDHACNYTTAKKWIEEFAPECFTDVPADELERMKATDTIWTLQIYPNTPVGFNWWHAATLDAAIDAAIGASS